MCELREQRLDEEDAAANLARASETLKKERELLAKKGRLIEQSLGAINQVREGLMLRCFWIIQKSAQRFACVHTACHCRIHGTHACCPL